MSSSCLGALPQKGGGAVLIPSKETVLEICKIYTCSSFQGRTTVRQVTQTFSYYGAESEGVVVLGGPRGKEYVRYFFGKGNPDLEVTPQLLSLTNTPSLLSS